jgi:hypothetical protein
MRQQLAIIQENQKRMIELGAMVVVAIDMMQQPTG